MARSLFIVPFALFIIAPHIAWAEDDGDQGAKFDQYILDQGFELRGHVYVLPIEDELTDAIEKLQSDADAFRKASSHDAKIRKLVGKTSVLIEELTVRRDWLAKELEQNHTLDDDPQRGQLKRINAELQQLKRLTEPTSTSIGVEADQRAAALARPLAQAWAIAGEVKETYNDLRSDDEIEDTLYRLNEFADQKHQLGPSAEFRESVNWLRSIRSAAMSGSLVAEKREDELWLTVQLNDLPPRAMRVEPFTETTLIPAAWAEELDVAFDESATGQTIERTGRLQPLTPADPWDDYGAFGSSIEDFGQASEEEANSLVIARETELQWVQIGRVVRHGIAVSVIDKDEADQTPVLGKTFFDAFHFRIDEKTGVIRLNLRPLREPGNDYGLYDHYGGFPDYSSW